MPLNRTAQELQHMSDDSLILEIRDGIMEATRRPSARPALRRLLEGEIEDLSILHRHTTKARTGGLPDVSDVSGLKR